jgi:acyl dehydratase
MSTAPSYDQLKVGDVLPSLELPPITRLQLALYCGGSGDHNPIHVDSDFARQAGMKDVFAHGMLSMGFMGRLITSWVPQSAVRSFGVRFAAITWIGDEITVVGQITQKNEDMQQVTLDLQCVNQNGEFTLKGRAVLAFDRATGGSRINKPRC